MQDGRLYGYNCKTLWGQAWMQTPYNKQWCSKVKHEQSIVRQKLKPFYADKQIALMCLANYSINFVGLLSCTDCL